MAKTPEQPQPVPEAGSDMVKLAFLVPRSWRDALADAAGAQGISMADLIRIVLRGYLRERYNGGERAALGTQL